MELKETKEAIEGVMAGLEFVDSNLKDGVQVFKDAAAFMDVLPKLQAAIEGIEKVLPELKNSTSSARAEILNWFEQRFDIPNDQVEGWVEAVLQILNASLDILKKKKLLASA